MDAIGGTVECANRLSLPRIAGLLLPRPQIYARLNEWAPVTVVRGPSGSGKTTQVAAWLEGQSPDELTVVWVTARSTTRDVKDFEVELIESLRNAVATPGPVWHSALSGFDELASELRNAPPSRKFVLVLDSSRYVQAEEVGEELLSLVERHRQFHLVLCCRGRHPIEALATGTIAVNAIEPEEMLLGVEEIVGLSQVLGSLSTVKGPRACTERSGVVLRPCGWC